VRLAALICLLFLAAAPAADAATAGVEELAGEGAKGMPLTVGTLAFRADPGESNDVSFTPDPGGLVVHDGGAPLLAGDGCTSVDENTARCVAPLGAVGLSNADVQLGDGDDRVTLDGLLGSVVAGGDGADVLAGGAGYDRLDGGPGADTVAGGEGGDVLSGGPGTDTVLGGADDDALSGDDAAGGDPDQIDGGDGIDTVRYEGRLWGVKVDLAAGTGAEDTLVGVEGAVGGDGNDSLTGDGHDNRLDGGPGDDTLHGAAGTDELGGDAGDDVLDGGENGDVLLGGTGRDRLRGGPEPDHLYGGAGADLVAGGPGDDTIDAGEPAKAAADAVACGSGRDLVNAPTLPDVLAADCERATFEQRDTGDLPVTVSLRIRQAMARVTCFTGDDDERCGGRLSIGSRAGSAAARFRMPNGSRAVRLRRRGTLGATRTFAFRGYETAGGERFPVRGGFRAQRTTPAS
jgi:Ca2+-binding RTX toxin-like protein